MTGKDATYTHGHHESVLRSHTCARPRTPQRICCRSCGRG